MNYTIEHNYYIYIMASQSGTLYIGVTNNLDSRVARAKARELKVKDYIIKANYTPKETVELIKKYLT